MRFILMQSHTGIIIAYVKRNNHVKILHKNWEEKIIIIMNQFSFDLCPN